MAYLVKEMFLTLQGEGARAGTAAVFLRFAGCNLWTGRDVDRDKAVCQFCDTDFVGTDGTGGGRFESAQHLADSVSAKWAGKKSDGDKWVVITGGEPALQIDDALVHALHAQSFKIAIETNGTLALPHGIDWVCVSPKAGSELVVKNGHELKLVFPQVDFLPEQFESLAFAHFLIQPMDGLFRKKNTELAIQYCLDNPKWRLSVQTHKWLGIA